MTTSRTLLLVAGLATWVAAGFETLDALWRKQVGWDLRAVVWCTAYAAFAVAFVSQQRPSAKPVARVALLALESLAGLVVVVAGRGELTVVLLAVVAGQAPFTLSARAAIGWVVAQSVATLCVHATLGGGAWSNLAGFVAFQIFALGAAHLAVREVKARAELAWAHAELLGTQALLAASTREAERLRISRELHDSAGHHLTALALQLEVAKNASGEQAADAIARAREIARDLLTELRQVVRDLRDGRRVELEPALRALAAGVPGLRVELHVAPEIALDSATAHALFRCAQEAITNALRHARARRLSIDVTEDDGHVVLVARDDGRGAERVEPGAGLAGLRERLELLGGSLELCTRPGEGFVVKGLAPSRKGA